MLNSLSYLHSNSSKVTFQLKGHEINIQVDSKNHTVFNTFQTTQKIAETISFSLTLSQVVDILHCTDALKITFDQDSDKLSFEYTTYNKHIKKMTIGRTQVKVNKPVTYSPQFIFAHDDIAKLLDVAHQNPTFEKLSFQHEKLLQVIESGRVIR